MDNCCRPCAFQTVIAGCPETIQVNSKFTPGAVLYWRIKDYHGNLYILQFTADAEGKGVINTTELPDGFCNWASYGFEIEVSQDEAGLIPVQLQLTTSYPRIEVVLENSNLPLNQIGV